jgi:hypothetical protein
MGWQQPVDVDSSCSGNPGGADVDREEPKPPRMGPLTTSRTTFGNRNDIHATSQKRWVRRSSRWIELNQRGLADEPFASKDLLARRFALRKNQASPQKPADRRKGARWIGSNGRQGRAASSRMVGGMELTPNATKGMTTSTQKGTPDPLRAMTRVWYALLAKSKVLLLWPPKGRQNPTEQTRRKVAGRQYVRSRIAAARPAVRSSCTPQTPVRRCGRCRADVGAGVPKQTSAESEGAHPKNGTLSADATCLPPCGSRCAVWLAPAETRPACRRLVAGDGSDRGWDIMPADTASLADGLDAESKAVGSGGITPKRAARAASG